MPWINDVVNGVQIVPAWGNNMRDHVVQVFVNKSEMTNQAVPKDGMMAFCVDTRITYVSVGGVWWVYSMPWRTFPGTVFMAPASGGGMTPQSTTGSAWWRQSMGAGQYIGQLISAPPATFTYYLIYFTMPVMMQGAQQGGMARVSSPGYGIVHGGFAQWIDNGAPAGGSRCQVVEAGGGAPPVGTGIRFSTLAMSIELDMNFMCDPTVDSP